MKSRFTGRPISWIVMACVFVIMSAMWYHRMYSYYLRAEHYPDNKCPCAITDSLEGIDRYVARESLMCTALMMWGNMPIQLSGPFLVHILNVPQMFIFQTAVVFFYNRYVHKRRRLQGS